VALILSGIQSYPERLSAASKTEFFPKTPQDSAEASQDQFQGFPRTCSWCKKDPQNNMEAGAELGFEIPPVHTSAPISFHYSRLIPTSDIPGPLRAGAPQHFLAFLRFVLAMPSPCPCLALRLLNLLMAVAFPRPVCATEASFQKDLSSELHLSDRAVLGSS